MGIGYTIFKSTIGNVFRRFFVKGMLSRAEKAAGIAKIGFSYMLLSEYISSYSIEKAYRMAAVISNEVFSDPTLDTEASNFLRNNKDLIKSEIMRIGQDPEICGFVLRALYTKGVYYAYGKNTPEFYQRSIDKLKKYDWFMPDENPQLDEFEKEACDYMTKYTKIVSTIKKERPL